MTSELLPLILRINIALAIAIIVVLQLRVPARRFFGARVAYSLWLMPLVAAAMCFVPGRVERMVLPESDTPIPAYAGVADIVAQPDYLLWAWAGGALLSLAILALRQFRFTQALGKLSAREDLGAGVHAAESRTHGPAVVGVLKPMIVTPSDFDARFDEEERRIVLAHERAHLAQGDPWINAIALVVQCLSWFNPLVHIAVRALRVDQELACDATVLAQAEGVRRRYAEAMLKTHIATAVPIGCAWPPSDLSSFKERIAMLKRTLPSRTQTLAGVSVIAIATAAAAAAAWAAQPTRVITTLVPSQVERSTPLAPDGAELIRAHADDELDGLDSLAHLEHLESLQHLEALESLESLETLANLEGELDGDERIYIDGRLVEGRELTPEEREEIRQSLREARQAMDEAREEARRAIAEANMEGRRAQMEAAREAMTAAREAMEESRVEREAAMREAHENMRMVDIDVERIRIETNAQVREALAEARVEIAEAMAEARAEGDEERVRELREAERSIREVERQHHD